MAVDLARYVVSLEAQTAKYVQELDKANRKLDRFHKDQERAVAKIKSAFLNIGAGLAAAFSVRAIAQFTRSSIDAADQIGEISAAAGIGAESLQELRFAFDELGGVASGQTDIGLQRFNRTLGLAINGSRQAQQQFKLLGLDLKDLGGGTEASLEAVLRSLGEIENDARRAAIAGRLFGEELGPKLAAVLKGGSQALDDAREQVTGIISDESVRRASALDDAFKRMAATIGGPLKQAAIGAAFEIAKIFGFVEDAPIDVLNERIEESRLQIESLQRSIAENQAVKRHDGFLGFVFGSDTMDADLARLQAALLQAQMNLAVFEAAAAKSGGAAADGLAEFNDGLEEISAASARMLPVTQEFFKQWQALWSDEGLSEVSAAVTKMPDDLNKLSPAFNTFAASLRSSFQDMESESAKTAQSIGANFQDAFAGWILGAERSFSDLLKRMAAQMVTSALFKGLATLFPGGSFFSNFFGGARAEGGPVSAGRAYLVGERGPEMFIPSGSGMIAANAGGGRTISIGNIDARGATDPAATAAAVREAVITAVTIGDQRTDAKLRALGRPSMA